MTYPTEAALFSVTDQVRFHTNHFGGAVVRPPLCDVIERWADNGRWVYRLRTVETQMYITANESQIRSALLRVGDKFHVIEYRYAQAVVYRDRLYVEGLYGTVTVTYEVTYVGDNEDGETIYRAFNAGAFNDQGKDFAADEEDVIEVTPRSLDDRNKMRQYFRWTPDEAWEYVTASAVVVL